MSREHLIGPLDELEIGVVRSVELDGRTIGILRTRGGVFAIGNNCPHQGGPMCSGHVTGTMLPSRPDEYIYGHDGMVIKCPWHGYEFHVDTGDSVGGVLRGRVPVYETVIRDEQVYCRLVRVRPARTGEA